MAKAPKADIVANNKQKKPSKGPNVVEKVDKPMKTVEMKREKPNKKSLEKLIPHAKDSLKNGNGQILKKTKKQALIKPVESKVEQALESKKHIEKSKPQFVKPLKQKSNKPHAKKSPKIKPIKAEKVKKPVKKIYEPVSIDEAEFDAILSENNIAKTVKALKKLVEGEVAKKKTSIFGDYNYCLNVSCFKIPSCPKRMVKLNLKHSLVDIETDDIVLIVADLKRGSKVEYESTIEHYTDLLRDVGIENIKIMPYAQLRKEHKSFEEKRKLARTYDYFLCDGRIVGDIVGFCGSIFRKPRTTFHTVRMGKPKTLKNEILKSLRRTAFKQFSKGDLTTIAVGSHKLSATQVAENIVHVISQLKTIYPGGIDNIRGLDIKINIKGTTSLPLYASTSEGPQEQPYVVGPREQSLLNFKKQANNILSKFNLTKEADLQKLNKSQIERKRKIKETRALLIAENSKKSGETTKSLDDSDDDENGNETSEDDKNDENDNETSEDDKNDENDNEEEDDDDDDDDDDNDDDEKSADDNDEDENDSDDDDEDVEEVSPPKKLKKPIIEPKKTFQTKAFQKLMKKKTK